ncbi:MAG: FG-GAP repeat domain-containing protein [Promethearchaeota archaeon]
MRERLAFVLLLVLTVSLGSSLVMAAKPPKSALEVTITAPLDGQEVANGGTFAVTGSVLAKRGDAGLVKTFVQYAVGEGSTDFVNVEGPRLEIVPEGGDQPQTQTLLEDKSYSVSWTLTGDPGTYEVRIFSDGLTAKSGSSQSRTVTILGPPPPPGVETIDSERQDSEIGYGSTTGNYEDTYYADNVHQILSEERNTHGTKKPVDDSTDLGWIYVFDNLAPRTDTSFQLYGHAEMQGGLVLGEWEDSDTAFFVQFYSSGSWKTIMAITRYDVSDTMFCVDIPDDTSERLELRITDNDRKSGNKEISSLYIDQAYILFEPADEYFVADLPANIGNRAMKIGDIDNDSKNEVIVGFMGPVDDPLRYYKQANGLWTEHAIGISPSVSGAAFYGIFALEIGNHDNDDYNEVWVGVTYQSGESELRYYEKDGSAWTENIIACLESPVFALAVGDLDGDGAVEIAVGLGVYNGYELAYYKQQSSTWMRINVDDFGVSTSGVGSVRGVEIADIDDDASRELVCLIEQPNHLEDSALKYYKFNSGNWNQYDIPNVPFGLEIDTGDIDNDGKMEIAWGSFVQDQNVVRVYKYESTGWAEYGISNASGSSRQVCHIAFGDVDNDDLDELAIGLFDDGRSGLSEGGVRYYKYDGTTWVEHYVADPDLSAEVVLFGDVDTDGNNELLVGLVTWYSYSIQVPELRYYKID